MVLRIQGSLPFCSLSSLNFCNVICTPYLATFIEPPENLAPSALATIVSSLCPVMIPRVPPCSCALTSLCTVSFSRKSHSIFKSDGAHTRAPKSAEVNGLHRKPVRDVRDRSESRPRRTFENYARAVPFALIRPLFCPPSPAIFASFSSTRCCLAYRVPRVSASRR